ncbi:cleft lip and palate associated transmembrane protein 1, putative [Eimeria brunetti]|uniref:Cleft lip and palate associated transmembrane protein 1, putative n=1 Tax=Eimeria brunetti TaxID=51314 RepID=U6LTQ5_9EIME|nr:cleft lip and palate associated transmembrane protein 1, putative [Eimeria brunetti]
MHEKRQTLIETEMGSLNTFVDDVASFLIDMPWMHRLSCFRDDIIFIIYLYQRWIYRVDKSRGPSALGEQGAPLQAAETTTPTSAGSEGPAAAAPAAAAPAAAAPAAPAAAAEEKEQDGGDAAAGDTCKETEGLRRRLPAAAAAPTS